MNYGSNLRVVTLGAAQLVIVGQEMAFGASENSLRAAADAVRSSQVVCAN
jgi:hypothetical protein